MNNNIENERTKKDIEKDMATNRLLLVGLSFSSLIGAIMLLTDPTILSVAVTLINAGFMCYGMAAIEKNRRELETVEENKVDMKENENFEPVKEETKTLNLSKKLDEKHDYSFSVSEKTELKYIYNLTPIEVDRLEEYAKANKIDYETLLNYFNEYIEILENAYVYPDESKFEQFVSNKKLKKEKTIDNN